MASIDVGIHPDPAGITTKRFPGGPPASFSTLNIAAGASRVSIFVNNRAVLEALQAALDAIRADLDADAFPEIAQAAEESRPFPGQPRFPDERQFLNAPVAEAEQDAEPEAVAS